MIGPAGEGSRGWALALGVARLGTGTGWRPRLSLVRLGLAGPISGKAEMGRLGHWPTCASERRTHRLPPAEGSKHETRVTGQRDMAMWWRTGREIRQDKVPATARGGFTSRVAGFDGG